MPRINDGFGVQTYHHLLLSLKCEIENKNFAYTNTFFTDFISKYHYQNDTSYHQKVDNFFNLSFNEKYCLTIETPAWENDQKVNIYNIKDMEDFQEICVSELVHDKKIQDAISSRSNIFLNWRKKIINKYNSSAKPKLIFDKNTFNIAVHVRRGDVFLGPKNPKDDPIYKNMFASDIFFLESMKYLQSSYSKITNKKIKFYIFSQSPSESQPYKGAMTEKQFKDQKEFLKNVDIFTKFRNIPDIDSELIIDGDPFFDIHHLISSDVLLCSPSKYSAVAAFFQQGDVFPFIEERSIPRLNSSVAIKNKLQLPYKHLNEILSKEKNNFPSIIDYYKQKEYNI